MSKLSTIPQNPLLTFDEKRIHRLIVRLNKSELSSLDNARGKLPRAVAVRMATFASLPTIVNIPPINLIAWSSLAKTTGHLHQIIKTINQIDIDGIFLLETALNEVKVLRSKLTSVEFDE